MIQRRPHATGNCLAEYVGRHVDSRLDIWRIEDDHADHAPEQEFVTRPR
ncbi:hypothetical protein [Natrinema caseinilyticum]|nr:hypothetical protein [Natrinema caseinilyticum]